MSLTIPLKKHWFIYGILTAIILTCGKCPADINRDADIRNIITGSLIPDENYCDQPYIVVTKAGDFVCVLTTGKGGESSSSLHVVATISKDKGKTWSELIDIEPDSGNRSFWGVPFITPYGRIYVFYGWEVEPVEGHVLQKGKNHQYVYKYSDDSGRTWSAKRYEIPMRLTSVDKPDYRQPFWGIDNPTSHKGSMYFAFSKYAKSGGVGWVYKSDNIMTETDPEKLHFEMLPEDDKGIRNEDLGKMQDEHNIESLGEHGLFMVFRRVGITPGQSYSRDDGKTWSNPEMMTYYPGGRVIKHSRACAPVFRTSEGKYLFWFHNNSGTGTKKRNPVFITGGILKDDGFIHWSEPEILLYDDVPATNISYPGFVEHEGEFYFTETQKKEARFHKVDRSLLEGMWEQKNIREINGKEMVGEFDSQQLSAGQIEMPRDLNLSVQNGLTIDMWLRLDSLDAGKVIFDSRDKTGRGILIQTSDGRDISAPLNAELKGSIRIDISDGTNTAAWDVDAGKLKAGTLHNVVFIVDAGPKIISVILDGKYCDGDLEREYGWGRYANNIGQINGSKKAKVDNSLKSLRIYSRYLRTSEAIGNYNSELPVYTTVIEPATELVPRSDAASISQLSDGSLFMVYQKSDGGTGQDGGFKRIWSKTSTDGGYTWQQPRMVIDAEEGYIYAAGPAVVRLKSGALLLSCVGLLKDKPLTKQYLFRSDDDGKTFHELKPIWDKDRRDASQGGATSMIQLESGRIIFPVQCYLGTPLTDKKELRNAPRTSWCFYSDDEGKSWKESVKKVTLPKRGALEASIAQLAGGSLIMSVRTQLGGPYLAWSDDEGQNWSEPVFSGLEGGESCTCIRRIPGSDDIVLFWNNSKYDINHPSHFGKRTPLTAAVSSDGGKSWKMVKNLLADPDAEYTNLDCFFTRQGKAIITYMYSTAGFSRDRLPLEACVVDKKWFYQPD